MKKKGIIISSIIGVVVVAAVIITILLLAGPKKDNKELYTDAVQKSMGLIEDLDDESIESTLKELEEKLAKNIYKLTVDASVTQDEAGHSEAEGVIYFGKNQLFIDLKADSNDQEFNLQGMLKDDKFYINFKNVLENIYYIDKIDEMLKSVEDLGNAEDTKIIEKVLNYLVESISDSIDKDDVKTDTVELNINGKEYKTKQYGYTFTGTTLYNAVLKFVEKIKNDKDIVDELNKLIDSFASQIDDDFVNQIGDQFGDQIGGQMNFNLNKDSFKITKESLNDLLDQIPEMAKALKNYGNLLTYNVYLYDDEPISRQLTVIIPSEQGNAPIKLADYKVDGYYKIAVSTMGVEMYKLEIKKQDSKKYNISLEAMNQEFIKGYFISDDGDYELELESANDELLDFTLNLEINKDNTGSLEIESDAANLEVNYKIEKVDEVPKMDVSKSLSIENMTEADKAKLEEFTKLMNPMYYMKEENSIISFDELDFE